MSQYAFEPAARPAVPIEGETALFPVRRIICVGANYGAEARVAGTPINPDIEPAFFFAKPADAICPPGRDPHYPSATSLLHHEVELVIAIGASGADVPLDKALDLVFGYAVGVDMTRRDLQRLATAAKRPWDASKGFDDAAPISAIRRWSGPPPLGRIWLNVGGDVRQEGTLDHMNRNVAEVICEISKLWRLEPGDLIYSGSSPPSSGPLEQGDWVECGVEGVGKLDFTVR
jgi:fumarylpyruvate hydrolase